MPDPRPPLASGMLAVGDGHRLCWQTHGAPDGLPAVVLHGGPGAGASPRSLRAFDLAAWRVTLVDQRGCGASTPHAGDSLDGLQANTTAHLLADIEELRGHLGAPAWFVLGGSWGSTLALAYAISAPTRVTGLALAGVTMTRPGEIDWLYGHVGALLPEAFAAFRAGAPEGAPGRGLVAAYARRLADPDPARIARAAADWCAWEAAVVGDDPAAAGSRWTDPRWRLAFARIVTHYFENAGWLDDGALRRGAPALAAIPGAIIHSRLDLAAPRTTAWELARAWPGVETSVVDDAAHSATSPALIEATGAAIARFAVRIRRRATTARQASPLDTRRHAGAPTVHQTTAGSIGEAEPVLGAPQRNARDGATAAQALPRR